MEPDSILQGCLDTHRELLKLEQSFHAWLNEMTGYEHPPMIPA